MRINYRAAQHQDVLTASRGPPGRDSGCLQLEATFRREKERDTKRGASPQSAPDVQECLQELTGVEGCCFTYFLPPKQKGTRKIIN